MMTGKKLHERTRVALSPGLVWYAEPGQETAQAASIWNDAKEVRTIPAWHAAMLGACSGEFTIAEISARIGVSCAEIIAELESWEASAPGTVEIAEETARAERHTQAALEMFRRFDAERAGDTGQALGDFHSRLIAHAFEQFDARETTVSHLYRRAHPALSGRSYGAAFYDAVAEKIRAGSKMDILEIGGGTGVFADEFLKRFKDLAPAVYAACTYCIADLSPELQRSQAEQTAAHAPAVRFLTGDILQMPLPESGFDMIICNEMIADLPVALIDTAGGRVLQGAPDSYELIRRYELQKLLHGPKCYCNTGAVLLLERISRLLRPEGYAVLTEYGTLSDPPIPVQLYQHREFSIQFDVLECAAGKLNFQTAIRSLGEWLGFIGDYVLIHEQTLTCLAHRLLPRIGGPSLERWAYDEPMLKAALGDKYPHFGNIRRTAVSDRSVLSPFKFFALDIWKS